MKPKFDPTLYVILRDAGFNNIASASLLGVSEASVRRGLAGYQPDEPSKVRQLLNELADVLEARDNLRA